MPADDPPSEKEREFLRMLQKPREYARWAAGVRDEWLSKRINLQAVAGRDRPVIPGGDGDRLVVSNGRRPL